MYEYLNRTRNFARSAKEWPKNMYNNYQAQCCQRLSRLHSYLIIGKQYTYVKFTPSFVKLQMNKP